LHVTSEEFDELAQFIEQARDGHFGLKYVYALPDHAGKFYRKRRAKYEQAIAESAIADLAATIAEYM
jgi:hypothetical protein